MTAPTSSQLFPRPVQFRPEVGAVGDMWMTGTSARPLLRGSALCLYVMQWAFSFGLLLLPE